MQPWEWACINLGKAAIIALPSINNEKGKNEYSAIWFKKLRSAGMLC
jgi:hypothetical protein